MEWKGRWERSGKKRVIRCTRGPLRNCSPLGVANGPSIDERDGCRCTRERRAACAWPRASTSGPLKLISRFINGHLLPLAPSLLPPKLATCDFFPIPSIPFLFLSPMITDRIKYYEYFQVFWSILVILSSLVRILSIISNLLYEFDGFESYESGKHLKRRSIPIYMPSRFLSRILINEIIGTRGKVRSITRLFRYFPIDFLPRNFH